MDALLMEELERLKKQRERARSYEGPTMPFKHMGHDREAMAPWLSHTEVAGAVRMLMRNQLDHEAVCCMARDRILHLAQTNERIRAAFRVNMLRLDPTISHAEIDAILDGSDR